MAREGFWRTLRAGRAEDGTLGLAPVIAYGDASFASSGRGGMAAPTSAMRTSAKAVCGAHAVVDVDEFYTSAKHALTPAGEVCGEFLSDVVDERVGHSKRVRRDPSPRGAAGRVPARGVKRCPTCFTFADRDANAARNSEWPTTTTVSQRPRSSRPPHPAVLCAYWAKELGQPRPGYLRDPHVLTPGTMGGVSGRPPVYIRSERPQGP